MTPAYAAASIAATLGIGFLSYHFPNVARAAFAAACLAVVIVVLNFVEYVA